MSVSRSMRLCLALLGLVLLSSGAAAAPAAHASAAPAYTLTRTALSPVPMPTLAAALSAVTPACQRSAQPASAASPFTLTFTAIDATNTAIDTSTPFKLPILPYPVIYGATVTNSSATPTAATTLALLFSDYQTLLLAAESGSSLAQKFVTHKIPALAPGASVTTILTHTYTSGANSIFAGILDPFCHQNFVHPAFTVVTPLLLAPTADIVPVSSGVMVTAGPAAPTGSLVSTDTFGVAVLLFNYGQKAATADVPVQFASPMIGKPIRATIKAADLPAPGSSAPYSLRDSGGTPLTFTAKTVTKALLAPVTVSLTLPPGATSQAHSRTIRVPVTLRPTGIDLSVTFLALDCPLLAGRSSPLTIEIANAGSQATTAAFLVQLSVDGKAVGGPLSVAGLAAVTRTDISTSITIPKAGKHKISVTVDAAKANADYTKTNNTQTFTRVVLVG